MKKKIVIRKRVEFIGGPFDGSVADVELMRNQEEKCNELAVPYGAGTDIECAVQEPIEKYAHIYRFESCKASRRGNDVVEYAGVAEIL